MTDTSAPRSRKRRFAAVLAIGAIGLLAVRRASRMPPHEPLASSPPPSCDPVDTALSRGVEPLAAAHPGLSGIHLLPDPRDAFAARVLLARGAQSTLDLQYYIWHGDVTGTLMLEAVHAAADRGVRVRLLLDDNGIAGLDTILAALGRHPSIEVRLFNPFRIRRPKAVGYLVDFDRLNRRMHNKSFVADGAVAIVGGRNIGDEYFGAGDGGLFADLDLLAIGAAVTDVVADFECYWACASTWRADAILPRPRTAALDRLSKRASAIERDARARRYVERLRDLPIVRQLIDGTLPLEWAPVQMISDDPAKGLGNAPEGGLLIDSLAKVLGTPTAELEIVAGYFVPGDDMVTWLCGLARSGVAVSVFTNGYATTDVGLVHAGYAPVRRPLLEAGVRLFEMKARADDDDAVRDRRIGRRIGIGSTLQGSGKGSTAALRSGASTLHAKTFAIDRRHLFVGSFNLDPRSRDLNTELGFLIDSPALTAQVTEALAREAATATWEVGLDGDGRHCWTDAESREIYNREPGMTPLDHAFIAGALRLPIKWLL